MASAAALNWGYFVQHGAAASAPALSLRSPIASVRGLLRAPGRLVSNAIVFAGWLLYLGALKLAPLSLVQATSAGGIGILALFVARLGHTRLSSTERASVLLALAGLALLGVSLGSHATVEHASSTRATVVWLSASALVAALAAGPAARMLSAGAGLGVAAGIMFAGADISTKAAITGAHRFWWFVPVLLALYSVGFVALQLGFQRGGALATAGLASLFTNAIPIAAGIALFHNAVPSGALGALRIASFIAVIAGAALLARPEEQAHGAGQMH